MSTSPTPWRLNSYCAQGHATTLRFLVDQGGRLVLDLPDGYLFCLTCRELKAVPQRVSWWAKRRALKKAQRELRNFGGFSD